MRHKKAGPVVAKFAQGLDRLLAVKQKAQYQTSSVARSEAIKAVERATRLDDEAADIVMCRRANTTGSAEAVSVVGSFDRRDDAAPRNRIYPIAALPTPGQGPARVSETTAEKEVPWPPEHKRSNEQEMPKDVNAGDPADGAPPTHPRMTAEGPERFGIRHRRRHRRRLRRTLITLSTVLILALAVNAVVLSRQTEAAKLTAPGASLIPTAEGTMQVLVQGDPAGTPIVLVHGVEASLHWFDRITPLLARDHLVIRVDLIGNGGSAKPGPGHYSIEDQARALGDVLESLHIQHVTAVGHSMGGHVVTALAEQHPADVSRIVVLDTGATEGARSLGTAASLSTKPVIGPGIKTLVKVAGNAGPDPAAEAFAPGFDVAKGFPNPDQPRDDINAMTYTAFKEEQAAAPPYVAAEPLHQRLAALGKPVLVIFGTRDQVVVGQAENLALFRTVPGAIVRTIPGIGHSPQVEAPQQTASRILAFVGSQ